MPEHIDVSLRLLHPALYRAVMLYATGFVALGINFLIFTPTYLIFGMPNELWGALLLAIGATELFFLNVVNRLSHVRQAMAAGIALCLILAAGTCEPFIHHVGSLQLPLMYLGLAATQYPLLIEPPVNPWTKR
jgi:hypothetical protein